MPEQKQLVKQSQARKLAQVKAKREQLGRDLYPEWYPLKSRSTR